MKSNYDSQVIEVPSSSWLRRLLGVHDRIQLISPTERLVDSVLDLAMREFGRFDPTVASCPDYGKMKLERSFGNMLEWRELDGSRRIVETVAASKRRFGEQAVANAVVGNESNGQSGRMVYTEELTFVAGSPEELDLSASPELHQGVDFTQGTSTAS